MRKALVVLPCVLAFGCGDNIEPPPDEMDLATQTATSDKADDAPHGTLELTAFISAFSGSCTDTSAEIEVVASYADGSAIGQLACTLTFADGSTAEGCLVDHLFPAGGVHVVSAHVTDLSTGAFVDVTDNVHVYPIPTYDLEVTAPECGLELSYKATIDLGAETHVFVEPADKVIAEPGYDQLRENTVQVTEAGTYTVRFAIEDERQAGPICSYELTKEVTVTACPTEEPPCEH